MKTLATCALALLLFSTAQLASADKPPSAQNEAPEMSSRYLWQHDLKPTPEMWFYLQERERREDPRAVVRRAAQKKAAQRRDRIAAKKALGLSSSRPNAYNTVFGAHFAPRYSSYWSNYNARVWFASDTSDRSETVRR